MTTNQAFTIGGGASQTAIMAELAGLDYEPAGEILDRVRQASAGVHADGQPVATLAGLAYADDTIEASQAMTAREWTGSTEVWRTSTLLHLRERAARQAARAMAGLVGPDNAYVEVIDEIVGDPESQAVRVGVEEPIPGNPDQAVRVVYTCPTRPLMRRAE